MPQKIYGFPMEGNMPGDVDFYVLSNEDIGWEANLVTGTNDNISIALPYPSSVDLDEETIVVHALEFLILNDPGMANTFQLLAAYLSYLDKEFPAAFRGIGDDTADEALKAQFAGPIWFGEDKANVAAAASVEGNERHADRHVNAIYFPPVPLDLLTPLYIQFVNHNSTVTLATNANVAADFTNEEFVYLRVWYTRRRLTASEKAARATGLRFMMLDS